MRRSSSRIAADRHANGLSRSVVEQVDDTKAWQEGTHSLNSGEQQGTVEHVHPYGFTSVPNIPASGAVRRAAGAIFSFLGGNRSHGIAILIGDRRFRLYKLANGEVALHDDQGQQVHLRRDGLWASVPNSKKIMLQVMDDDSMPQDAPSGAQVKNGQIQQAGRAAAINLVLDNTQFTLNHPNGTVNFNCAAYNINASGAVTVNAGGNIKLISQVYALVSGAKAAIIYSVKDIYQKALISINVKSPQNLVTPDWAQGAQDPPITS